MSRTANLKVRAAALLAAVAAIAMVVALGFTSPAQAANAGDLDTSFDGDGRVVFDVFGGVDDSAQAVAIQPDGKIVLAGSWCGFAAQCNTSTFALARFNPDGSLDKVFGSGGRTLVTFPNGRAGASDVAIQPDGKIVAAGWRNDDDGVDDADFAVVRLEPDGDLDPSFSGDGKVMTTFGGSDYGEAVAIQADGKIVVAGSNESSGDEDFALARYNVNGSLDTSFHGDGKVNTGFGSDSEGAMAVAIQTNAAPGDHRTRIVVGGTTDDDNCPLDCDYDFALARYHANGSLDSSFDGDGKLTTGFLSSSDVAVAVAIQTGGRIVAAGHTTNTGDYDFALARYNSDGSLDGSFEGGTVVTELGEWDEAEAVAIQADGRIVAAGWSGPSQWEPDSFALTRYNTDGSLDASFSGDGRLTTSFGGDTWAKDVAIQADGRIAAAGGAESEDGDYDFAISRYHAITDNTPPNTTITSGPSGATNSTSATFTFVSSESPSKFECSLDGAPFSTCSSPKSYSDLTDGSHVFRVRAIDASGNIEQSPAQRTFTVDTKAPKVNSVLPTQDATGVAQGVNVKATFSEAMSASSITSETVKLFRAGTTTPVAAVVGYDTQTKTAMLNPEIDLRPGTRYKAVVTTAARDLGGNRLDQDQDLTNGNQPNVWTFTTGSN
ncbi:MAG TPA: Ig-like domain-containing protein [Rubrobacter sp.]|nr:Ig-like domain-containing protein [Rubrobacter sp.]